MTFFEKFENRNCAPRLGREHNFANFMFELRSVEDSYFANGSSLLVRNENHENQLDVRLAECAGALGGDLRGSEIRLKTSGVGLTHQRLSTTRAADSIATHIPPGLS